MINLPSKIKDLFYNPNTDSISSLLQNIQDAHIEILKNTDLKKSTLSSKQEDNELKVKDFMIPDEGLSRESLTILTAELFQGVSRWHSPRTMYNVAPPPLIPTVATKTFTSLYNPNLCLNTASGESLVTEQKVIKAIAKYVGWDWQTAGGTFTWGGKATSMYGIKLGLRNCMPNSSTQGVQKDVVVFSTDSGHPCHTSDADWLGIGTDNVIRLKTNQDSRINLDEMESVVKEKIKKGKRVAAIIISGGTTNNMICDPIEEVVKLRDKIVLDLSLDYKPHVHVDAVVAFPWIFFKEYDFSLNDLNINQEALTRISKIVKDLKGLNYADSFGIDFHKMGFCPYISCVFMVKDKKLLYGDNGMQKWPFNYTMENSRSADGPNTAYIALNVLGVNGFQLLIAHLTEMAVDLQNRIMDTGYFEVINRKGLGTSVMFVPHIPDQVSIDNPKEETIIRNNYTSRFIKKNQQLGNPFYIDQIPGYSTGATPYPFNSLKAYIMSPHSNIESNIDFVEFLVTLKKEIDSDFDFTDINVAPESELPHPLK